MNSKELRTKYCEFYKTKNHAIIASAPLIPENDPTVLFTTAGMHPLVPYLMGSPHPAGKRLVNSQKCIRTGDIDEVGDDWHCTFFEMLGNWSLGDYFKTEAITWTHEFLTKVLPFKPEQLACTVFEGEGDIPFDETSYNAWLKLGIPKERIFKLGRKDNFWGPVGGAGPCGPDSETFFITRDHCTLKNPDCSPACSCGRYVEICNNVFMEFEKKKDGGFVKLPKPNVDFGMGLLRVCSILSGSKSVYESDIYGPAMSYLNEVGPKLSTKDKRIIADHVMAAMFAIGDGASPSNVGSGYIIRRILRRAFRLANQGGLEPHYIDHLVDRFNQVYQGHYSEVTQGRNKIIGIIRDEEEKFSKALGQGLKHLEKELAKFDSSTKVIDGKLAFFMFETYGFPLEVTEEIAAERGLTVDKAAFDVAFEEHQNKSRTAGEKLFKGGLADTSEESTKLHTATHLLHEALRRILGPHVEQKGSNITPERLRFDFSHPDKMTAEQIKQVEDLVNEQIKRNLDIKLEDMTLDDAKARGAIGLFEDKYGARINVYFMGDFSKEVCGGPHVRNTSELISFKIQKEEASSRGVRRIKAIVGKS
ncbi:MAG: alanine--tRNA ligase [Proteobacteria bacterium]|nr:alanine--tRNA ligase [Pseudomonadota bacterium]